VKESSEYITFVCVCVCLFVCLFVASYAFIIRNLNYEKFAAIVGKKCLLSIMEFAVYTVSWHRVSWGTWLTLCHGWRKKERKKNQLSGLSFAFILDEQARTVMCLENYVQTFRLINYINPQSCHNRENDLFVSIHGYTVA
jgi:hypothetical protein